MACGLRISDWSSDVCSADLVVEFGGRLQVTEYHHGVQAFNVHAGLKQIPRAGDKSSLTRAAHVFKHVRAVVGAAHALKSVVILGRLILLSAPADRKRVV